MLRAGWAMGREPPSLGFRGGMHPELLGWGGFLSWPLPRPRVDPVALLPCSLCGNCLGSEGARRLWEALRENRTLEELYLDITGITDSGLDNLVPCLLANSTLRLLTIVGNRLSEAGQRTLSELSRRKPGLKVISTFESDMGLLQAYLDWVEEIKADPDQMDAVKNADALRCIVSVLRDLDESRTSPEARARIRELRREISALLGEKE
ncbi:nucleotide-binding oligomerization domain-containing protein 2-like [Terrapene carolina triunguis]|uniref:nucleotide-binding oligomerization domain-containing protein 2-like n=1 Tax=Terrapene triunguis TaxID=2587831 RepID=UPI000E77F56B|nr:nucleotide-binding oligomerization domain-containing protein 2-like [Terrapene carolina triunguis]